MREQKLSFPEQLEALRTRLLAQATPEQLAFARRYFPWHAVFLSDIAPLDRPVLESLLAGGLAEELRVGEHLLVRPSRKGLVLAGLRPERRDKPEVVLDQAWLFHAVRRELGALGEGATAHKSKAFSARLRGQGRMLLVVSKPSLHPVAVQNRIRREIAGDFDELVFYCSNFTEVAVVVERLPEPKRARVRVESL